MLNTDAPKNSILIKRKPTPERTLLKPPGHSDSARTSVSCPQIGSRERRLGPYPVRTRWPTAHCFDLRSDSWYILSSGSWDPRTDQLLSRSGLRIPTRRLRRFSLSSISYVPLRGEKMIPSLSEPILSELSAQSYSRIRSFNGGERGLLDLALRRCSVSQGS